jgi:hypothetical protein
MSLTRRFSVAGLSAVMITVIAGALFASSALAQPALPFKAYGSGLKAGQVVTATKGTTEVARATVDANGNWTMDIPADKANPGDAIGFTLDGQRANQTITYQNGQFVPPPGLALTVAAGGGAAPTPGPAKTGNAGLLGQSTGSNTTMILAFGAMALVLAAGARAATRTR